MIEIRMPKINTVTFTGYLGADPRKNTTQGGTAVCSFPVIQNKRYKTRDGEWKDAAPTAVNVVVWGKRAESLGSRLHKGSPVCVSGELQLTKWTGQDGVNHSRVEIKGDYIQALERTRGEGEPPVDAYENADDEYDGDDQPDYSDDIPF